MALIARRGKTLGKNKKNKKNKNKTKKGKEKTKKQIFRESGGTLAVSSQPTSRPGQHPGPLPGSFVGSNAGMLPRQGPSFFQIPELFVFFCFFLVFFCFIFVFFCFFCFCLGFSLLLALKANLGSRIQTTSHVYVGACCTHGANG